MRTIQEIIGASGGAADVAAKAGVSVRAVRKWYFDGVHARHWHALDATPDELIEAHMPIWHGEMEESA